MPLCPLRSSQSIKESCRLTDFQKCAFFEIIRGFSQSSGIFGLLLSILMKYHYVKNLHLLSGLGSGVINGLLFNFQFYLLILCLILYQKEIINPFEARLQLLIQAKKTTKKCLKHLSKFQVTLLQSSTGN